jgi:hypothetical protein
VQGGLFDQVSLTNQEETMEITVRISLLSLLLALSGCSLFRSPAVQTELQNISLVYRFRTVTPQGLSIIDGKLKQGTLTIDSTGVGDFPPCEATDTSGIDLDLFRDSSGTLQSARLQADSLVVSQFEPTPPNPPCPTPGAPPTLTINTGMGLSIGMPDATGQAIIRINGIEYSSGTLYSKFIIQNRDATTGFTTGSFEFLGRNVADPNDLRIVVVRDGVFAIMEP